MLVTGGTTDVTTFFMMRKTSDGTSATGLTPADFDLTYCRTGAAPAAKVDATALAATNSAHTDNRCIEIDATNMPGLYRVDWPDAAFAAGVREVSLSVKVATAFTETKIVQIDAPVDSFDPATDTVDGITYDSVFECLLAVLTGVATVSGSDVLFKKRDGTTTKMTITYSTPSGTRSGSAINS